MPKSPLEVPTARLEPQPSAVYYFDLCFEETCVKPDIRAIYGDSEGRRRQEGLIERFLVSLRYFIYFQNWTASEGIGVLK